MKRIVMFALVAAVAVAFTGCKKKEPVTVVGMPEKINQVTQDAVKDAAKVGADAQKAVDSALTK
jgi:PBP1b-binding outer membrane lipoprotein LpoB